MLWLARLPVWLWPLAIGVIVLGYSVGVKRGGAVAPVNQAPAAQTTPTLLDYGASPSGGSASSGAAGSPVLNPGIGTTAATSDRVMATVSGYTPAGVPRSTADVPNKYVLPTPGQTPGSGGYVAPVPGYVPSTPPAGPYIR